VCLVPALGLDIMHVIRLCYMGEILKTMITLCNMGAVEKLQGEWSRVGKRPNFQDTTGMPSPKQVELFEQFHRTFAQFCDHRNYSSQVGFSVLRSLVIKYTLPFLRKVVILLHVRHGIVFPNTAFEKMDEPEHVRLSEALQFPSFDEILKSVLEMNQDGGRLRLILSTWALQVTQQRKVLTVPHPSIFELVGLPLRYDTLMDEAMKRRCPNSGKDLSDPSVCLFCGEIFCSQAVCCAIRGKGGCNQHLEKFDSFPIG
jgi:E3 ubiquitin-protein ligase UBR1